MKDRAPEKPLFRIRLARADHAGSIFPRIKNVATATACTSHAELTLLAGIAHPRSEVNSRVWIFNATTRAERDQGITRRLARKQRLRELRFALLVSSSALNDSAILVAECRKCRGVVVAGISVARE